MSRSELVTARRRSYPPPASGVDQALRGMTEVIGAVAGNGEQVTNSGSVTTVGEGDELQAQHRVTDGPDQRAGGWLCAP